MYLPVVLILFGVLFTEETIVKRSGDSSHWCCDIVPPKVRQNITRIVQVPVVESITKNITIERTCTSEEVQQQINEYNQQWGHQFGFHTHHSHHDGLYKCVDTVPRTYTQHTMKTMNKTEVVETPGVCPDQHLHCCDGFELVAGNCIRKGLKNTLQELIDAGLVGK